jgi:hypothetical protein
MNTFFIISLGVAMLAVLVVMLMGIVSMTKGGDFNKKYGNKLMQARVYLQGLALFCFAMAVVTSQA